MIDMILKNKHDIDICQKLSNFTDEEIDDNLFRLLEWTQDVNWPVAECISNRIAKLNTNNLINSLETILKGNDSLWKCSILLLLLPKMNHTMLKKLIPTLKLITKNPSIDDIDNDIPEIVNVVLSKVLTSNYPKNHSSKNEQFF